MLYLFAYELERPLSGYPELVGFIDEQTPQAHLLDNVWIIDSSDSPFNIQRRLKELVGEQDHFYLVDLSKSVVAWSGLEAEIGEFIGRFTEPIAQDVSQQLLTFAYDETPKLDGLDFEARPLLQNVWQVETTTIPEEFIKQLRSAFGESGRLLVADVSLAPAAWSGLPEDAAYAAVAYTRTEQGSEQRQEF